MVLPKDIAALRPASNKDSFFHFLLDSREMERLIKCCVICRKRE